MRQVILEQPGRFVCADAAPPARQANEALVRVHRVGVCGTDLHAYAGEQPYFTYPRILGHELSVEVVETSMAGETGLQPGDRCAVEPYLSCGDCHACRLGKYNCCEQLRVLGVHTDGGMREYLAVPADRLHKSGKLSLDQLALVETLGIGAHAVQRSGLRAGENVFVVGAGPIGLAVTQFACAAGGSVRVLETNR
ncbi:MAG TPA: alcohol dehydrogenase catalytic domain-containing protein, partial [Terriglobia bacterium]|nr:alcohol dehydrogenase catalytic domain-containing protein [Terriglobia bacterium]